MDRELQVKEIIKLLKERETESRKISGLTLFAISTALAAIAWSALRPLSEASDLDAAVLYHSLTLNIIVSFWIFFSPLSKENRFANRKTDSIFEPAILIISMAALSLASNIYTYTHTNDAHPILSTTLLVTIIFYTISTAALFILITINALFYHGKGLPNPYIPDSNQVPRHLIAAQHLIWLSILLGNISAAAISISGNPQISEIQLGACLATIQVLAFILAGILTQGEKSNELFEIEIAYLFGEASLEEIESRLKLQIAGTLLGDIVKEKICDLHKQLDELEINLKDYRSCFENDIVPIESKYKTEIAARLNSLQKRMKLESRAKFSSIKELAEWLRALIRYKAKSNEALKLYIQSEFDLAHEKLEFFENDVGSLLADIDSFIANNEGVSA